MSTIAQLHTSDIRCRRPAQSGHFWRLPLQSVAALARTTRGWIAWRRQRQDLAVLNDHLLADIGVTREAALREAGKPFWA